VHILIHDYTGHPFQIQLGRKLADQGHQVAFAYAAELLTPRGNLSQSEGSGRQLRLIEVPMSASYRSNKYKFVKRRGFELAYGKELVRLLKEIKPEVLISGNTPSEPQWMLFQEANRMRIPAIHWLQDFYSIAVERLARKKLPVIGWLAGRWYRHLDAKCFSASSAIIAITDDFLPILREFGVRSEKVTVIPNWAPLDELPVRSRDNSWAAGHNLDKKFVFLYSGTLAMKHNPDLLLQLALKYRHNPEVRVVVISEGPGTEWLSAKKVEKSLDNLVILPFQPFESMPEVLATSDVLIVVLEADAGSFSVPSKVLTYHCAQRPILGAIPSENLAARIINENSSGLCVPPENTSRFLDAAESLRTDTSLRNTCAANARLFAERDFDIEQIAARFEMVANSVLRSH
jgi:glycosyltransferase involved in cell wall biosynthesis